MRIESWKSALTVALLAGSVSAIDLDIKNESTSPITSP